MLNQLKIALAVGIGASLAACGGGGSSGASSLSGRVIDGYIKGAKVCLDLNNNFACDASEPSATTGDGGAYTFAYSGSVTGLQVLAEVPLGAVDEDQGAITKPYNLLAPAENPATVTPLTTLVSHEMVTSGASLTQASQTIKTQYSFQTDPVGYDFKFRGDTTTALVAQTVAASIAKVNDLLKSDNTVNSTLSQAEMMKAAINQVQTKILPSLIKADGTVNTPTCASAQCTQAELISNVATTATNAISGNIQAIIAQTKSGDGTVTSFKDALTIGVVTARIGSGDYINGQTGVNGSRGGYTKALEMSYISLAGDTLNEIRKAYVNGAWYTKYQSADKVTFLDGTTWKSYFKTSTGPDGDIAIEGNCVTFKRTSATTPDQKICATRKDLSGKKAGEIFPDICKQQDNANTAIANCNADSPLPLGSYGYELGFSTASETYTFYAPDDGWTGYNFTGSNINGATPTVLKFLEATVDNPQWKGSGCSTGFRVKSQSVDKRTGVIEWGANSGDSCSSPTVTSYSEETNYKITTIGGKDVVTIGVPALYRQLNPGDMQGGCQFAFAVVSQYNNGVGVYSGDYCPANTKSTIPFTGDISTGEQFMSRTLANFILSLRGMTAFPTLAQ